MNTLNLNSKKVNKGTVAIINEFVYANRETLSNEMKDYYRTVANMIDGEVRKPSVRRASMTEVLGRAYNVEALILASGALSVTTEYVTA